MRFLFKWLDNRLRASRENMLVAVPPAAGAFCTRTLNVDSMNFSIYRANGGYVIETRFRNDDDRKINISEPNYSLYIVTDDKDLGQEISKIMMLETLKY